MEGIKLGIPLDREKQLFHDYLAKIGKLQSRVIVVSLISVLLLAVIQIGVQLGVLSLSEAQVRMLSSIMASIFIIIVVTAFLKLSTPLLNRFFFFIDGQSRSILLRAWNYGVWVIAILVILAQFTGHIQSLGISIGVFSAGVAIALQQPITSVVGWLVILYKRPYKVGDRIVVRDIRGDVAEITAFYTVLREFGREMQGDDPTGVKITIPNNIILTEPILNYTSDFPYVWDYVSVAVTYESDVALARELVRKASLDVLGESMRKAVERMRPYLYGTPQEAELSEEPHIYTKFADSSVVLDVKYICRANKKRAVRSDISSKILESFNLPENRGKVTIAYPHTELVFHDQSIRGAFKKFLEQR